MAHLQLNCDYVEITSDTRHLCQISLAAAFILLLLLLCFCGEGVQSNDELETRSLHRKSVIVAAAAVVLTTFVPICRLNLKLIVTCARDQH